MFPSLYSWIIRAGRQKKKDNQPRLKKFKLKSNLTCNIATAMVTFSYAKITWYFYMCRYQVYNKAHLIFHWWLLMIKCSNMFCKHNRLTKLYQSNLKKGKWKQGKQISDLFLIIPLDFIPRTFPSVVHNLFQFICF